MRRVATRRFEVPEQRRRVEKKKGKRKEKEIEAEEKDPPLT